MLDLDAFLLQVYVQVDTFCKQSLPPTSTRRGRPPSLSVAEVLTLAVVSQWAQFPSERAFYRYAHRNLRPCFPRLPAYSQFNRLLRKQQKTLLALFLSLTARLKRAEQGYEIMDTTGIATRNAQRRGDGWLPLAADIGKCSRLGWYEGFHPLTCVAPDGSLTGFSFGPASAQDMHLAETFLDQRAQSAPALPSVGQTRSGVYLADKSFNGRDAQLRWASQYAASVVSAPRRCDPNPWPRWLKRRLSSMRQIVESLHAKLLHTFRLATERAHTLSGFWTRLTAKMTLYNLCIWINRQHGRAPLAFADLIDW